MANLALPPIGVKVLYFDIAGTTASGMQLIRAPVISLLHGRLADNAVNNHIHSDSDGSGRSRDRPWKLPHA